MNAPGAWNALGLAATTDAAAIRRAYVLRLRALDLETDVAGFIALRQAYEAALAWALREPPPTSGDDKAAEQFEPSAAPLQPPPREFAPPPPHPEPPQIGAPGSDLNGASAAEAIDEFEGALAQETFDRAADLGDTFTAERAFASLMARGGAALGTEAAMIDRLVSVATTDFDYPADRYAELVERLGFMSDRRSREDPNPALRATVRQRLGAQDWYTALVANATDLSRLGGHAARQNRLSARLLLGSSSDRPFAGITTATLNQRLIEYRRHAAAPWLAARISPAQIAELEAEQKRRARNDLFYLIPFGLFASAIVMNGILLVIHGLLTGVWHWKWTE